MNTKSHDNYLRNLTRNPPIPKRSLTYWVFGALTAIIAFVKSFDAEFDSSYVLFLAGISLTFCIAGTVVWRKERRNETPKFDEFLRASLVSDKYTIHQFVILSTLLTISATIVFFVEWSFGVVVAFPSVIFGYMAYVSLRKKKSEPDTSV